MFIEEEIQEVFEETEEKRHRKPFKKHNPDKGTKLKLIPLGGLDEIGKNCMLLEYENEMIIIDIGLAFPDDTMPGVDMVVPDFSYVHKNIDKLKGVVITHAHEDHIGGLGFFYRSIPNKSVPLYASPFTLNIIGEKFREYFKNRKFDFREFNNRDIIHVGKNIQVEFIRITHSIPEAFVVAVHTPEGIVVHTGDYKFDLTPVDGRYVDFFKLAELGEKGTLLLLSDSTNANKEGFTPSELTVIKAFREILHKAKGRVIVALFSSHGHRVQEMIKAANDFGRKTALDGRSLHRTFAAGQDSKVIDVPDSIITLEQAPSYKEDKILIICTGTQGELMSSLSRASRGQHKEIKIEEGDIVIISANSIPGNEVSINNVVNELTKKGAIVYSHGRAGLHVSGHGCRGDIALMLNLIKPKFFMPVHGEYQHISASKNLAIDYGMKPENIVLTKNGDVVSLTKNSIEITGTVESGNILIDDKFASGTANMSVKDRNIMANEGLLIIHLLINTKSRKLHGQLEIIAKGIGNPGIVNDLKKEIVLKFGDEKVNDLFDFKTKVKELCRKESKRRLYKDPLIVVLVANV